MPAVPKLMPTRRFLQRLGAASCFLFFLLLWASRITSQDAAAYLSPEVMEVDLPDAPSSRRPSTAIVTTILNPDLSFPVWLDYHLRKVDRILLFLDDPSEAALLHELTHDKPVTLFNGSTTVPDMTPESRLIYRQDANNNAAIQYALANNIEWLIHIDIDELFYDNDNSTWMTMPNVGLVRFNNVEAVFLPYEVDNYFDDCRLFKLHYGGVPFSAYALGKSAVRVTANVRSDGPHGFAGYENEGVFVDNPIILHYPTPTYRRWIAKFQHYGNFSDFWYNDPTRPLFPFMTLSRDLIRSAFETGDWEEAHKYYTSWIPDAESVSRYLESGGLIRVSPFM